MHRAYRGSSLLFFLSPLRDACSSLPLPSLQDERDLFGTLKSASSFYSERIEIFPFWDEIRDDFGGSKPSPFPRESKISSFPPARGKARLEKAFRQETTALFRLLIGRRRRSFSPPEKRWSPLFSRFKVGVSPFREFPLPSSQGQNVPVAFRFPRSGERPLSCPG